ncbi:uncharacterized protein LOC118411493 isoform X2 [Branchiostoma floridae]|uniref:Uncharacterized protein LOC118411493 isoform X2 n=1 Tax=Branchiostoma floridae TaxID=7739 RepID=A0A9J7KSK2_BRAFL|nr:uncharacterized protein LOC118411493 isoform X2 [Branchiostoma floridae]
MFWWSLAALVVVGSSFGRTQTTTENPQDSFQYLEQMEFPTITAVDPDGDASSLLTVKACAQKCLDLDNSCRAFGTNHGTFRSCYFYNELEAPANRSIKDLYIKIGPTTEQPALLTQTTGGATQQKQTSRPVTATTSTEQTTSSPYATSKRQTATSSTYVTATSTGQTNSSMYAPPGGSSGDNTGAIAGGVIAVLLLVLLIVLAVPLWRRYKKRKRGEAFYDRMQQNVRMDGIPVDAGTAVRFSAAGNRSNGKTEQEILLEQGPADGGTVEYATVNKNRKKAEPDRQELKSAEGAAEGADLEDDDPSGYDTLQRTRDPYLYPMTIADFDQSEDPEPDQVTYAQLDLEDKGGNRPVIGGESEEDKTVYSQLRHSRMKYDNLRR